MAAEERLCNLSQRLTSAVEKLNKTLDEIPYDTADRGVLLDALHRIELVEESLAPLTDQ